MCRGPFVPLPDQLFEHLGMLGGEVVALGAVGHHIVKLPLGALFVADGLEVAVAHGGISSISGGGHKRQGKQEVGFVRGYQ